MQEKAGLGAVLTAMIGRYPAEIHDAPLDQRSS